MYFSRFHYPYGLLKYADIYLDTGNRDVEHHVDTVYAFTWSGLQKKLNKWYDRHRYDLKMTVDEQTL
jgi:hypothetical protein